MPLFAPENATKSLSHRRLYAAYELAYTITHFLTAFCFLVGSWFFFYDSLMTAGIWLFVVGSVLFALKPSLRLARELHFLAIGDPGDIYRRSGDG